MATLQPFLWIKIMSILFFNCLNSCQWIDRKSQKNQFTTLNILCNVNKDTKPGWLLPCQLAWNLYHTFNKQCHATICKFVNFLLDTQGASIVDINFTSCTRKSTLKLIQWNTMKSINTGLKKMQSKLLCQVSQHLRCMDIRPPLLQSWIYKLSFDQYFYHFVP